MEEIYWLSFPLWVQKASFFTWCLNTQRLNLVVSFVPPKNGNMSRSGRLVVLCWDVPLGLIHAFISSGLVMLKPVCFTVQFSSSCLHLPLLPLLSAVLLSTALKTYLLLTIRPRGKKAIRACAHSHCRLAGTFAGRSVF